MPPFILDISEYGRAPDTNELSFIGLIDRLKLSYL